MEVHQENFYSAVRFTELIVVPDLESGGTGPSLQHEDGWFI